ncbi:hypothetical protein [Dolosigranulum pigrum]|uniref:hypothetical protein n=1 Tax=Dolosigranulum pigrum TaxID=29394 RepID=UPI0015EBD52D|nr:hypothetical protein [Dolosigranulum pigrum]
MILHIIFQAILIGLAAMVLLTIGSSTTEMVITGTVYVILSLLLSGLADKINNRKRPRH